MHWGRRSRTFSACPVDPLKTEEKLPKHLLDVLLNIQSDVKDTEECGFCFVRKGCMQVQCLGSDSYIVSLNTITIRLRCFGPITVLLQEHYDNPTPSTPPNHLFFRHGEPNVLRDLAVSPLYSPSSMFLCTASNQVLDMEALCRLSGDSCVLLD